MLDNGWEGYFIHHTHSCWSRVPFSCLAKPFFEHPHVAFAWFHVCWLRTTWTPIAVGKHCKHPYFSWQPPRLWVNNHRHLGNKYVCYLNPPCVVGWLTILAVGKPTMFLLLTHRESNMAKVLQFINDFPMIFQKVSRFFWGIPSRLFMPQFWVAVPL